MLLQPTTTKPPPIYPYQNHSHFYSAKGLSFSSGLLRNFTFSLKQPIKPTTPKNHEKHPVVVACSSTPPARSYGTVDYERTPSTLKWGAIYNRISMLEKSTLGSASVLTQVENEGKKITKWELSKVVKELRKFRRYKFALEVYDWMNDRPERFRVTTSDTAIQLDLISKVHGIPNAEQYFQELPDVLKDKRIFGSLLNAYVRAKMTERAESLMDKMRLKNYANHSLPFNVMMTLYVNLGDHEKVESIISEMTEKNIALDLYTYNIWLSSCGSRGSLDKMEQVFQRMELDENIESNWATFSTMATIYIKSGNIEKAENFLRKMESQLAARDRMPYHYLISLYGTTGKKEEVLRIWNIYRASFVNIPNLGFHTVISALVRADDIDGAEKIYDEWLSLRSRGDPRVGNLLLSGYVKKGLSEKASTFLDRMIERGENPNPTTWEIMSEDHIRNMRISEALSCFKTALLAQGAESWKPKPINVVSMLEIFEKGDDVASKDALLEILRQVGCLDDPAYLSYIPLSGGGVPNVKDRVDADEGNDGNFELLDQLHESL